MKLLQRIHRWILAVRFALADYQRAHGPFGYPRREQHTTRNHHDLPPRSQRDPHFWN